MRIRGNRHGGINFKSNNGGPRKYIIIAGQSNAGQGPHAVPADLPSGYQQTYEHIPSYQYATDRALKVKPLNYLDNTTYQDPVQTAVFALNFALPVAAQAQVGGDLYNVMYSQGDTNLSGDWKPTATVGALYTNLVDKINQFKRGCANADGVDPTCLFLYWNQGEKDGRVLADANNYQTNLTNFINNLRTAVGISALPILIGKLNTNVQNASVNPITYWATIQTAQTAVSQGGGSAISGVYLVDHDSATMNPDWIHYTVAGYDTIASQIISAAISHGLI